MLNYADDETIIRNAISKRLNAEPGVNVLEIVIKEHPQHIAVGVLWDVHDVVIGESIFHLPPSFEISHIHNEVDEIAEGCKEAKRTFALRLAGLSDDYTLSDVIKAKGTGERGNWKYGERTH